MSVQVQLNVRIVSDGEFQSTFPLSAHVVQSDREPPRPYGQRAKREDRVLPDGSSTIVPGLSVSLGS